MLFILKNEKLSRLRIARIHLKSGGCAQRDSDTIFRCERKGRYGTTLSYFVSQALLCVLDDPHMNAFSKAK